MSGHSKWHSIKHKKALVDARKGKLFAKLIRAVEVAARDGGGVADSNPNLQTAIDKARGAGMPTDTIERAIKRGTGELGGVSYETITYEGYAPGGVALLVEVMTDNRNRAAAAVRSTLTKAGGSLGEPGSVAWMFTQRSVVLVPRDSIEEDPLLEVVLEAGADEIKEEGDSWMVVGEPSDLGPLKKAVEDAGLEIQSAELTMEPNAGVPLELESARTVLRVIGELEDLDDVQEVYSNFDVPDDVLEEAAL